MNVRVQIYNYDMGLFRKAYIRIADLNYVNATNQSMVERAFILPDNDPFGHGLPETFA